LAVQPHRETRTHIPRRGPVEQAPAPVVDDVLEQVAAAIDEEDLPEGQDHRIRSTHRDQRAMLEARRRERRKNGTLNRMGGQFNLDIIPDACLDLKNWVYRWVLDTSSKITFLTQQDDYVFVEPHEIKGAIINTLHGQESSERVRILGGVGGQGQPIYHYLLKKPRDFYSEDYEGVVRDRDDLVHARVSEAHIDADEMGERALAGNAYIPDHTQPQMAYASGRKRGHVGRSFK
jgi:hypothetical protein